MMVTIEVDGRELQVDQGRNLLQSCLDHGIYIPNLCWMKDMKEPLASCRLCFVEIEGFDEPVSSCTVTPRQGMVVRTETPTVRRLQKTAFRLLLTAQHGMCRQCPANKRCGLQKLARFLDVGLRPKGLEPLERELDESQHHPFLTYDPYRCVLCGRCVFICASRNATPVVTFAHRGFKTTVRFSDGSDPGELPCRKCLACIDVCPVAAIGLDENSLQAVG